MNTAAFRTQKNTRRHPGCPSKNPPDTLAEHTLNARTQINGVQSLNAGFPVSNAARHPLVDSFGILLEFRLGGVQQAQNLLNTADNLLNTVLILQCE